MSIQIKKLKEITLSDYSFGILIAIAFLLPIFFLPLVGISIDYTKNFFLQIATIVSLILWLIARLRIGKLSIPKTYLLYFAFLIPLIFLISSFYSSSINTSIFGFGNESGTFITILALFLIMVLSSIHFQTMSRILHLYSWVIASSVILAVYHLARLALGADFLTFSVLTSPTSSLVGKWNDLAVFFGFISIISLVFLHLPYISRITRIFMSSVLVVSLFFVALINFSFVWILVGIFSLVIFVYVAFFSEEQSALDGGEFKFSINRSVLLPLVISVISIIFLIPSNPANNYLTQKLNISYIEARPSWGSTIDVAKDTFKENLLMGAGPNRFAEQWSKYKPTSVNESVFWKTNFDFGVGVIPTFAVTTGLLGILAWIVFLAWLVFIGGKFVFTRHQNRTTHYLVFSSFILSMYLWVTAIFYVPSIPILTLAFMMTGVFIASLVISGNIKKSEFSFLENQKVGFVSVLVIIVFIITSIIGGYFFIQRMTSVYFFSNGIKEFNVNGDIISAETAILKASKLYESDIYYRALSEAQIARISVILSQNDVGQEEIRAQFQNALGNAIDSARKTISLDEADYLNWISLGKVYESIILVGVEGAYENAVSSYNNVLSLNPKSPEIYLILARTEISKGDLDKAKEHISRALELKSNYTEAIFLLSQIQAGEGKLKAAIETAEKASILSPNDIGVFFQLGFLRYQNKDYNGAIFALERAVALQPIYSNAKYFLGLSYEKVDRTTDAILQFQDIEYLNPNNEEVKRILSNLRSNNDPFADIAPPLPEERDGLPIEE